MLGWAVLFIEPLPKRWPGLRELRRVWGRITGTRSTAGYCFQREVIGVGMISPVLLPDVGRLCRAVNSKLLVASLARKVLGSSSLRRPLVVWNYLPLNASIELQQRMDPDLTIYDCVTDWKHDPYSGQSVIFEDRLVESADMVLADSRPLVDKMSTLHSVVARVPPAVDYELFEPARRQRAGSRARPICAYFGSVGPDIDLDVLRKVSESFRLRVIGPIRVKLEGLGDGAELIEPVPREQLPSLLADADVLLLPYRRVKHTEGVIPAKTFECLATGKPTVACGLPCLQEFENLIYLCDSSTDVVATVPRAFQEDPKLRERRLELARANTWQVRIDQIEEILLTGLSEAGAI
jgi:glycosyltransferase involved in cell wall biosynthesis